LIRETVPPPKEQVLEASRAEQQIQGEGNIGQTGGEIAAQKQVQVAAPVPLAT